MASIDYEGCDEVFVGAGWAGVYSFYRRIRDDPKRGPHSCLFEQSWRVGGRTYSVKINQTDFVQDVGAYRFSPDMHLPGDLIMNHLNLATECYEKHCPSAKEDFPLPFLFNYSAPLRRLVDPVTGLPNGYATPLHRMIETAKGLGGRVFTSTALTKFEVDEKDGESSSCLNLQFHNTMTNQHIHIVDPSVLILNLPRNKLFQVSGVEESLEPKVASILKCTNFDMPSSLFSDRPTDDVTTLEKVYLYYEDAWWRTALNISDGEWPLPASFFTRPTKEGLRFNVHWHDGPVKCDKGSRGEQCRGLLEVYYSISNETFYSSLAPYPEEPLGSVWNTGDNNHAIEKLDKVHEGLMDIVSPLFNAKGVQSNHIAPPKGMIVGVWNRPTSNSPFGEGYTAPTKVLYDPTMSGPPDRACKVAGLTDELYRDTALQPWALQNLPNIFLVNNDWICMNVRYFYGDWAEESLLQAERAMLLLQTPRPAWLDETYYHKKVVSKASMKFSGQNNILTSHSDRKSLTWMGLAGVAIVSSMLYKRLVSQKRNYSALP